MKNIYLAMMTVTLLSACASRPESIPRRSSHRKSTAAMIAPVVDLPERCARRLQKVSAMQDSKDNMEAATVFLALVPGSKLIGDHAADVAKLEVEVEAIERAQIKKRVKRHGSLKTIEN